MIITGSVEAAHWSHLPTGQEWCLLWEDLSLVIALVLLDQRFEVYHQRLDHSFLVACLQWLFREERGLGLSSLSEAIWRERFTEGTFLPLHEFLFKKFVLVLKCRFYFIFNKFFLLIGTFNDLLGLPFGDISFDPLIDLIFHLLLFLLHLQSLHLLLLILTIDLLPHRTISLLFFLVSE